MADVGAPAKQTPQTRSAPASGAERGQILSMSAALVLFLFIVAAMTGALPSGLQNSLADFSARIYIDVPRATEDSSIAAGPGSPSTTAPAASGEAGAPPAETTTILRPTTTINEIGPLPTDAPTTTTSTTSSTSTTVKTTTTRPPTTDPTPTDPPPTDPPPTIVIPTTQPECVVPAIERADAQIQTNNKVVQVTVRFSGEIGHMQAGLAGQGFSPLTKVGNAFLGSITSSTAVAPGTNVVLVACNGTFTYTVKTHA